jgi:L-lactate dehydrogenase complex protein LldE
VRVSLFIPCFVDQLTPQVGLAAAKVLKKLGQEVEFNSSQTCCGQPSYNSGQWEIAKEGAIRSLEVFKDAEVVVGPSGSCVAMMKKFYPELLHGTKYEAEAKRLSQRTFEFSDFIVSQLKITDVGATLNKKVTYHDGCHALRELRLKEEPRKLLRAVKGLELIETEESESCCGFGGLFSVKFPMISTAMVQVKAGALARTGADYIVSSDPSCLLQIGGWLSREGKVIRPLHIAELLAMGIEHV